MAKKKSEAQIKKEMELIQSGTPLYPVYYDPFMHLHFVNGNKKIGNNILHYDTIPGDTILKRKDGLVYTNIAGTCHGCCDTCGHCKPDGKAPDCYAMRYVIGHHNSCMKNYAKNTVLIRHDIAKFETELNDALRNCFNPVLRPHVSGEFDSKEELEITIEAAKNNPRSILYTYSKRNSWINEWMDKHGDLPSNYVINVSPFNNDLDNPFELPEFIYDDGSNPEIAKLPHCPAVDKNGRETGWTCQMCATRMPEFSCLFNKRGSKKAVYAH